MKWSLNQSTENKPMISWSFCGSQNYKTNCNHFFTLKHFCAKSYYCSILIFWYHTYREHICNLVRTCAFHLEALNSNGGEIWPKKVKMYRNYSDIFPIGRYQPESTSFPNWLTGKNLSEPV